MVKKPFETQINPDAIGVLPQELDVPAENKKQAKKLKLTSEQFQQHLNADPKLKTAWQESQAIMERQKKATERIKNTGYLGTLWGGITGDSGLDDMQRINEDTNTAHKKFRDALDQNTQLDAGLKKQLIGYKLGAENGTNKATSQAAGDFSERAENYAGATKAVRNTAIGAGLGVSAVLTGGATLGAASTILAGGGSATMVGGVAVGGALTGSLGNAGYSLLRDEAGVALESGLNKKNLGQVQNDKNEQILANAVQANKDGTKVGVALPLAAAPLGAGVLALGGSYFGAKSAQNSAENFLQADQLSRQESAARKSGDTQYANTLEQQKKDHIIEGTLSAGDTAAVLGVGRMANGALKKVKGTQNLETGTPSTPKGGPASPEPSITPRTNRDALGLGPKTRENLRRNPDKPVEGATLPAAGTGFKKVESTPGKYLDLGAQQGSGKNIRRNPDKPVEGTTLPEPGTGFKKMIPPELSEPRSRHDTHVTEISPDGTKIIRGNNLGINAPYQQTEITIPPGGSALKEYRFASQARAGGLSESQIRLRNENAKVVPESGDNRPLTFFKERRYGGAGLEPRITQKEGYDPRNNRNFYKLERQEGFHHFEPLSDTVPFPQKPYVDTDRAKIIGRKPERKPEIQAAYDARNERRRADMLPSSSLPDHLQKVTTPPAKVEAPKSKPVPTNEEIEATRLLKKKSSTPSRTL